MADELTLSAQVGRTLGTGSSKRLRAEGKVPGVIYGLDQESVVVEVNYADLRKVLTTDAGFNAVITLEFDGKRELSIVKELQRHPVRRDVLHVDFIRLDPDATVSVEVRITLVGTAKQVENGGFVDHVLYSLAIDAKPNAIPDELEIDITDLELGGTLTVSAISLPAGVTTEVDGEEPVVLGAIARVVEEETPAEGEEGEEGEEGAEGEGGDADSDGDSGDSDGDADSDG